MKTIKISKKTIDLIKELRVKYSNDLKNINKNQILNNLQSDIDRYLKIFELKNLDDSVINLFKMLLKDKCVYMRYIHDITITDYATNKDNFDNLLEIFFNNFSEYCNRIDETINNLVDRKNKEKAI